MKKRIYFTKVSPQDTKNLAIHVEISADRNTALELLAFGVRNVMTSLDIATTEFLEAFLEARESTSIRRQVVDTSLLAQLPTDSPCEEKSL